MGDFVNVFIGAPNGQTAVSLSSADKIHVSIAAGFTGSNGGGGGATNITITRAATTVTVNSDTGTDGTIAAADGTNAGVMTAAMQVKLAGIETGAEVNDSAAEILAKVITVDGAGSGLDADMLDGNHASAFAAAVHTHVIGDVTGLQTALDGKAATVHTHAIGDVTGLQTALDGKAATVHTHAIGDVTGLQTALDGKAATVHTHAASDITSGTLDGDRLPGLSTTKRGGVPATGTPSGKYLKDDGTWDTPAGSGGVSDGDKGDITVSSSGTVWTIDNNAVTLAKIQDITTARILGRVTAGSGDPEQLTGTEVTTLLDTFTSSLKGLAPASGGGTSNFLRADGTWAAPSGGGGGGNTQIYIDQSPDNGTYGAISGSINGTNTIFTVSQAVYITGSLVVMLDGVLLTQGASQDWTETTPASGTFTLNFAPATGSVLTVWYNKTVVVGANFTSGTAAPTGGSDGDIYLQYT